MSFLHRVPAVGRRGRAGAAAVLAAVFAVLTVLVVAFPDNAADAGVMRFAAQHAWQPAVSAANVIVGLGTPLLVGVVTLGVVLLRDRAPGGDHRLARDRRVDAVLRLILLSVCVVVLKNAIGRPGPYLPTPDRHPILGFLESLGHVGGATEGAFPSGHTSTAIVCAFLLLRPYTGRRRLAYAVWVGLVSCGLILLNYHWLSDVVGAWLLGAFVLTVPLPLPPFLPGAGAERAAGRRQAESSPCPDSTLQSQPG